jgi:hypothetical protein
MVQGIPSAVYSFSTDEHISTVMDYDHKIQQLNDSLRQLNLVNLMTSVNNEGFPKLPMLCKWGLTPCSYLGHDWNNLHKICKQSMQD